MTDKDYSLLRPFDLEAAKSGEKLIWLKEPCALLGESINKPNRPNLGAQYCIEHASGLSYATSNDLSMAPLCWLEGKPVYKGDILRNKLSGTVFVVDIYDDEHDAFSSKSSILFFHSRNFTWTKPVTMVKREGWVNIYKGACASKYESKELADTAASHQRIACIRIEWEEPA